MFRYQIHTDPEGTAAFLDRLNIHIDKAAFPPKPTTEAQESIQQLLFQKAQEHQQKQANLQMQMLAFNNQLRTKITNHWPTGGAMMCNNCGSSKTMFMCTRCGSTS